MSKLLTICAESISLFLRVCHTFAQFAIITRKSRLYLVSWSNLRLVDGVFNRKSKKKSFKHITRHIRREDPNYTYICTLIFNYKTLFNLNARLHFCKLFSKYF